MASIVKPTIPIKVLVVGGSYSGLAAALNLRDLSYGLSPRYSGKVSCEGRASPIVPVRIKIVDERDGFFHLIGTPLAFASVPHAEKFWTKYSDIVALKDDRITITQGSILKVDCERKSATIIDAVSKKQYNETYDFLIAASGLRRATQVVPQSTTKELYLEEARKQIECVGITEGREKGVVIIGGGAVGIEMAAEIKMLHSEQTVTLIHSRDRLLSSEPLPDGVSDATIAILEESGIEVILGQRVLNSTEGKTGFTLKLSNGSDLKTGYVIWALSQQVATSTYLPKEALALDGCVKVTPHMNFAADIPNKLKHFAIGDLASWTGIKRCGGAMRMGYIAANNIYQDIIANHNAISFQKTNSRENNEIFADLAIDNLSNWNIYSEQKNFLECSKFPPLIALAVGNKGVSYGPEGTKSGEAVRKRFFDEDLGFTNCWKIIGLGEQV